MEKRPFGVFGSKFGYVLLQLSRGRMLDVGDRYAVFIAEFQADSEDTEFLCRHVRGDLLNVLEKVQLPFFGGSKFLVLQRSHAAHDPPLPAGRPR